MPRFAILTHDHPFPHWDFLLEAGQVCRTWRLLDEPAAGLTVPAEAIADHRLHYLTYEGPVSGDRGTVTRWDAGSFEWIVNERDRVDVELAGERLRGLCTIAACEDATHHACVFAAHDAPRKRTH